MTAASGARPRRRGDSARGSGGRGRSRDRRPSKQASRRRQASGYRPRPRRRSFRHRPRRSRRSTRTASRYGRLGPPGRCRELVSRARRGRATSRRVAPSELPGRTWVIASGGDARARAREAFLHPLDSCAASGSLPGRARVGTDRRPFARPAHSRAPSARRPSGRRAAPSCLDVAPTDGDYPRSRAHAGVRADEDAAAFAEVTTRDAIEAVGRKKPPELEWLWSSSVTVERSGKRVAAHLPLPVSSSTACFARGLAELGPPRRRAELGRLVTTSSS